VSSKGREENVARRGKGRRREGNEDGKWEEGSEERKVS